MAQIRADQLLATVARRMEWSLPSMPLHLTRGIWLSFETGGWCQ